MYIANIFEYKARDRAGKIFAGTIVADSQLAAAASIRDKGYFITQIKEQNQAKSFQKLNRIFQTVSLKDLAVFCRQFAAMVESGIPLLTCMNVLQQQTTNPLLKEALQDAYKRLQEGESLSKVMREYPKVFPNIMTGLIEAGELGGSLDTALNRLAIHFEKEYKMNRKVKSAMTYPVVIMLIAVLVVAFILIVVLPTFIKIFETNKVQLPLITRILLGTSSFLQEYWHVLLIAIVGGALLASLLYRRKDVKLIADTVVLVIPVFGMLLRKALIARFSRTLATLLRGGMPIITALELVRRTSTNSKMEQALEQAHISVTEGVGLAAPLIKSALFMPMVTQMVAIGEETGELDKMLDKIADFYESEVDDAVAQISSLIEPILIVFMGIVVGGIVLAVMLPMFDAVTSVGH